ncbi:MAG: ABC transporter permease subunit [Nitrososphaerota archaeon]
MNRWRGWHNHLLLSTFKRTPVIAITVFLLLFTYLPILWTMGTSFKGPQEWAARPPTFIPRNPTLANYIAQFIELPWEEYGAWYAAYGSSLPFIINSLIVITITIFLTFSITIAIAYISKTSQMAQKLSTSLVFIDAIPRISIAIGFLWLFTILRGLYDSYLGLSLAYTAEAIGFSIIAVKLFYDRVSRDVEESMWLAGFGKLRAFLLNLFTNCRTGLAISSFLTFIMCWQDFTYALILTNFKSTTTVRLASFTHEVGELFGPRAALATLIALPTLAITSLMWSRLREHYPALQLYEVQSPHLRSMPGNWAQNLKEGLFLFLYFLLFVLPFAMTAVYWLTFTSDVPLLERLQLQASRYLYALTNPAFHQSLARTWAITAITIAVTVGAGLFVAYQTIFYGERWYTLVFPLMTVPLLIPPIVSGYSFRIIFYPSGPAENLLTSLGLASIRWLADPAGSFLAVTLANIWSSLPFAILVMHGGGRTINRESYMSSLVMGAGRLRTFFTVISPQLKRYVFLVVLLVSIHTFEIFDIPYIMTFGGPGTATETVSFYMYINAFRAGDIPYMSALSVITGLIQIGSTLAMLRLIGRA